MNSDLRFIIEFLLDSCKDEYFMWDNFCFRNTRLSNLPDEWFDHIFNLDDYSRHLIEETVEDICYCYNDYDEANDCGVHYVSELIQYLF